MTFKIDGAGFYKNRKGEKVEIVNYRVSHGAWEDSEGNPYSEEGFKIFFGEDIISKWEEPLELENFSGNGESTEFTPKSYLVFNPQQSAPTRQHKTLGEAKTEAKRIAAKYPKQKVYVLETIACYTASVDVQEVGVV